MQRFAFLQKPFQTNAFDASPTIISLLAPKIISMPASKKRSSSDIAILDDKQIGMEAGLSQKDHRAVRLWLRLLSCSTQIEQVIRNRLRTEFGTTLARFDYLAQLARHPDGLRMKNLSRYLMVTGGNVTGLTDQLVHEGLVKRTNDLEDRRALIVQMTPKGKKWFEQVAIEHEKWLDELLGRLDPREMETLHNMLGQLRVVLSKDPDQKK